MTLLWEPDRALADLATGRVADAAAAYAPLLEKGGVAWYDSGRGGGGMWGIFSHAEVDRAAIDTRTFSSVTVPEGSPRILPLMADPPEHTGYRRLIGKFFSPAVIAKMEAEVRPFAGEMIDAMIAAGTADFAQHYAYGFSTRVLCHFLRVREDWTIYNDWSAAMEKSTGAGTATPGAALPDNLFGAIVPYIQALVAERRANPSDDVVSGIIGEEVNGALLNDEAVVGLTIALIVAGRSTTASGIANLVLRLARDIELQQYLRANPHRIPDAVEECLRIDAPQQEQPRKATRDVEVAGQLIKAGDAVFLNYGSANLDPARWEDPATFDIDRKTKAHFGFGRGLHQCFGAPLGRMEIRVSIEELLARTASFELAGAISRHTWPRLSVEELPLRFTPA